MLFEVFPETWFTIQPTFRELSALANVGGKIAVVTGASSGIGAALAKALSQEGAKVALTARRPDRLEKVARDCPNDVLVVAGDITLLQDRDRLVRETLNRWEQIDILINNAGVGGYAHFLDTSEALWRRLFEVNVFAPVFLTQAVLPGMLSRGTGLIINMGSIAALVAHSDRVSPYVASKHALLGFSRGLAKDLAGTGVRVLAPCPHLTDTEFFEKGTGKEEMVPVVERYHAFMDTSSAVARGILEQLGSESLILFPTEKPARAYHRQRDV